jgi:hypothetical protein
MSPPCPGSGPPGWSGTGPGAAGWAHSTVPGGAGVASGGAPQAPEAAPPPGGLAASTPAPQPGGSGTAGEGTGGRPSEGSSRPHPPSSGGGVGRRPSFSFLDPGGLAGGVAEATAASGGRRASGGRSGGGEAASGFPQALQNRALAKGTSWLQLGQIMVVSLPGVVTSRFGRCGGRSSPGPGRPRSCSTAGGGWEGWAPWRIGGR